MNKVSTNKTLALLIRAVMEGSVAFFLFASCCTNFKCLFFMICFFDGTFAKEANQRKKTGDSSADANTCYVSPPSAHSL